MKQDKIKEQDINYDKNSLYFGYSSRISILIVLFALLTIICGLLVSELINYNEKNNIKYIEVGKTTYEAKLKQNDIYKTNIIKEKDNLKLLSNLTDSLDINFNYKITFPKELIGNYNSKVIGELTIYDPNTKTNYYIETFELREETRNPFQDDQILINETINIDYNKYNDIVQKFKKNYNKEAQAKLKVYLNIQSNVKPLKYKNTKKVETILPIDISLGNTNINIYKTSIDKVGELKFKKHGTSIYTIIVEILVIILITVIISIFLKLNKLLSKLQNKPTHYDKELKRILDEYDNIIVNVSILPEEGKYKKVVIKEFDELLDLKNSINEPIRFIEISPHNKSYFFIKHKDEVFVYTLKNTSRER